MSPFYKMFPLASSMADALITSMAIFLRCNNVKTILSINKYSVISSNYCVGEM